MARAEQALAGALASTRFGLGARPGEIAEAAHDPRGFLKAQIVPVGADIPPSNGEPTAKRIGDLREYQQVRVQARMQSAEAAAQAGEDPVKAARSMLRDDTVTDVLARAQLAATTPAGFRERWALFWSNHFTVSGIKLATAMVVGPYENEAVRPHVFGRFADLLLAVESHPAMLLYLDQAQSIGPNSPAARRLASTGRRGGGLNENLAREILELHTVGVDGGYTQADVTEFARALTGMSIGGPRDPDAQGRTVFRAGAHEPGPRTVLKVRYDGAGAAQAQSILEDLARRPETARFVCRKIARHFLSDTPPPEVEGQLVRTWLKSDGDLAKVAEALIDAPEAWAPQPAKFKTPYDFLVSAYRAAKLQPWGFSQVGPVLTGLGQRPFSAPSPKGWPDDAQAWAAPDALIKRMQFAQGFAAQAARNQEPKAFAENALGALLTPATATAVARAESRNEAIALVLMSPEFQRR